MNHIKELHMGCLQCLEHGICTIFQGEQLTQMQACQESGDVPDPDTMLADIHDEYISQVNQSGMPKWIYDQLQSNNINI